MGNSGGMMHRIKRREFIKKLSVASIGTALAPSLPLPINKRSSSGHPKSKVAVVRDPKASTDNGQKIDSEIVQNMVDAAVKELTGQNKAADAFASLFPKQGTKDIIAIKVNCMHTHAFSESSHKVIDAVVKGLKSAGKEENDIILYDLKNEDLVSCGYTINSAKTGVRCFGNDEEDWGYEEKPVSPGGSAVHLSKILTRCAHLINIPVLRDHPTIGVSLSLKNHYGSVDSPSSLHGPNFKCEPHIAQLNALEPIRKKTRLIILPALVGVYEGHHSPPQFEYNGLIVSMDPVAVDTLGYKIIEEQRNKHDLRPLAKTGRYPSYIDSSAELGLGTNDPERIEKIMIG
jgi:uncharacterized protein (DUF362 family)